MKESEYFEQLCSGALKFHYEPLDKCAASVEMLSGAEQLNGYVRVF